MISNLEGVRVQVQKNVKDRRGLERLPEGQVLFVLALAVHPREVFERTELRDEGVDRGHHLERGVQDVGGVETEQLVRQRLHLQCSLK